MNRLLWLVCLMPALALAEPPASAEALVQTKVLKPLAAKESQRSRLSRARLPASARRIRVLEQAPVKDGKGGEFYSFAIDTRQGFLALGDEPEEGWHKDATTGCVYLATGETFVKLGDEVFPSDVLLGKRVKAAAENVCRARPSDT